MVRQHKSYKKNSKSSFQNERIQDFGCLWIDLRTQEEFGKCKI